MSGWEMQAEIERKIAWGERISRARYQRQMQEQAEAQRVRELEMIEVDAWI